MEPKKVRHIYWIQKELERHYQDFDLDKGVDLNRNGRIERSERTDRNNDGKVSLSEWKRFLNKNRTSLTALGGFFKCYFSWGQAYLPDNPIHDLLSIESEVVPEEDVKRAYETLDRIDRLSKEIRQGIPKISPHDKLISIYSATRTLGIPYGIDSMLFTQSLKAGALDCDTASFPALAIAHERGWPVYFVLAPDHGFLRWDDGKGIMFNMDFSSGWSFSRESYVKKFNIAKISEEKGVYLKNHDRGELISHFISMRGTHHNESKRYKEAINDFERALEFAPDSIFALINRSSARNGLKYYDLVIKEHDRIVALDPHSYKAYAVLGMALQGLERYEEADQAFKKALKFNFNSRDASVYVCLSNLRILQGDYDGAFSYATKAIEEVDPNNASAYYSRAAARMHRDKDKPFNAEKYRDILDDITKSMELDPDDADAKTFYENLKRILELDKQAAEMKRESKKQELELEKLREYYKKWLEKIERDRSAPSYIYTLIPHLFHLGIQARNKLAEDYAIDARIAAGATWPFVSIKKKFSYLSPRLEVGYNIHGDHHLLDL